LLKVEKGKGKDKISCTRPTPDPLPAASTSRGDPGEEKPAQAWWLDVASPLWEDMRMLGKASSSLFQKSQMVVPSKRKKGGGGLQLKRIISRHQKCRGQGGRGGREPGDKGREV